VEALFRKLIYDNTVDVVGATLIGLEDVEV
jgi:hypothetical protein